MPLKLIDANNLKKSFGNFIAVDNIDLAVHRGEVVGFLGPNGAGKSTTMKMLTGFLEPDSGDILINNIDLKSYPLEAKQFIGYLPEGAPSYSDMGRRQEPRLVLVRQDLFLVPEVETPLYINLLPE